MVTEKVKSAIKSKNKGVGTVGWAEGGHRPHWEGEFMQRLKADERVCHADIWRESPYCLENGRQQQIKG